MSTKSQFSVKMAGRESTWTPQLILPAEDARKGALIFTSQKMRVLRTSGKMFRTSDGGQTWKGAMGQLGGEPEVNVLTTMLARRLFTKCRDPGRSFERLSLERFSFLTPFVTYHNFRLLAAFGQ
jgi:hypothetical protein